MMGKLLIGRSPIIAAVLVASLILVLPALGVAEKKVTLRWVFRDEKIARIVEQQFEAEYPHIDIKAENLYTAVQWDWSKIIVQMVAGSAPDVYEMWPPAAREWMERGLLLDLAPLVARDLDSSVIEDFPEVLWEVSEVEGFRYGIPRYINCGCIWYNEDIIKASGLANPHELEQLGQWDWNALLQIARKTTSEASEGQVAIYGFDRKHDWAQWATSNGGAICGWPEDPTKVLLDEQPVQEALQWLQSLVWEYKVSPPWDRRWNYDFVRGNVAMTDTWGISTLMDWQRQLKDKYNMAPIPRAPAGGRVPYTFVDLWGIYAKTEHPEEAWTFVKFLIRPEVQVLFAQVEGDMPTRFSAMPAWVEFFPEVNLQYAIESAMSARPVPSALMPLWSKVQPIFDSIEQQVMGENKPVGPVTEDAARRIRLIYAEHEEAGK